MKTYIFTKPDGSTWEFFYDNSIRLWTVLNVNEFGHQLGEADYHIMKSDMIKDHGFDFKITLSKDTYKDSPKIKDAPIKIISYKFN
tara:strand:+ start:524 stop:781 length:258 start_codon:yes stop_codon:yes gene_type:complete